ncbi:MAG: tetratricopeptide repeat protein, partial [Thermodesulfovibrionales bacterium]
MTKNIQKHHDGAEKEIQETLADLKTRLWQKQRTLTYAAGAAILVLGAVAGASIYISSNTTKALDKSAEAYGLFYGDYQAGFKSPGERYTKALADFKASNAANGTPYALLYAANTSYELGDYDGCIKTLKELTGKTSDSRFLSLSYYKMAMAYIKKQDFAKAAASLTSLISIKDGVLQDLALLEIGKLSELTGKL